VNGKNCKGKARYGSPREAERAKKYSRHCRDVRLRIYRCDECKGWHLTSVSDGRDRRLARLRRFFRGEN
jgi:hypothetical protein